MGADPASPLFDNNNVELDFETWEIIPPNPDEIALARVAILPHDIPFQELNQLFLDSYNSQLAMPRFEVPESEAGLLLLLKGSDMNVIYAERLHHHHHHQSSGGSSSNLYFRDVGIAANPWLASTGNWRKRSYQIWLPIVHRLKGK